MLLTSRSFHAGSKGVVALLSAFALVSGSARASTPFLPTRGSDSAGVWSLAADQFKPSGTPQSFESLPLVPADSSNHFGANESSRPQLLPRNSDSGFSVKGTPHSQLSQLPSEQFPLQRSGSRQEFERNSFPPPAEPYGLTTDPSLDPSRLENDLYVLGPGDGLSMSFLDPTAGAVGGGFTILQDGTATLALLGSVQLTGLTIGQATRWLTSLYSAHLLRPQLFLSLTSPRPKRVSILGEVGRPGTYAIAGLSTPVDAIQTAGGITLNADIRNVLLRRRLPGPEGAQKETVLDLAQLLQFGNQRQTPLLFDGDTLFIARTDEPIPEEVLQIGASNLSPATISVTVIGEVRRPGTVTLPANSPLDEAVFRAGGPLPLRSNTRKVEILRMNRDGTKNLQVYSLASSMGIRGSSQRGISKENPPLRNNDTIIVNRSLYGSAVTVFNDFVFPIANTANQIYNYRWLWDDDRWR